MAGSLLAIARGALRGGLANREDAERRALQEEARRDRARQRELQDLQMAAQIYGEDAIVPAGTAGMSDVAGDALGALAGAAAGIPGAGTRAAAATPDGQLPRPIEIARRVASVGGQDIGVDTTRGTRARREQATKAAQRAQQIAGIQTITNPSTGQPYTEAEATAIADGLAKLPAFERQKPEKWVPTTREEALEFERATGAAAAPNWQIVHTDDGAVQVNPKTGETRPVRAPDGQQPLRGKTPASLVKASAENRTKLAVLDDAIAKVTAHPQSVGFKRGRMDAVDQRIDPAGVEARAAVADIGSIEIKTRSGANVTASEWPRIAPFVPRISDDAKTVLKKLRRMRQIIEEESAALEAAQGVPAAPPVAASSRHTAPAASPSPASGGDDLLAKYGLTPKGGR